MLYYMNMVELVNRTFGAIYDNTWCRFYTVVTLSYTFNNDPIPSGKYVLYDLNSNTADIL
mgnify:CR=1 FL=1